jgi:hypothetical protein
VAADEHAHEHASPDADQDGDADADQDANPNPLESAHADLYADKHADPAAADQHADPAAADQHADQHADPAQGDTDPVLWQRLLDRMAKGGSYHDLVSSAVPGRLLIAPGTAHPATGVHTGPSQRQAYGMLRLLDPRFECPTQSQRTSRPADL